MKLKRLLLISVVLCIFAFSSSVFAQGTEFTYQGRLLDNSIPATGNYDFEFSLWDSLAAGTQQGTTQTVTGVAVASGIFTVRLDFGAQFGGPSRFLQIAMRTAGGGAYTTLVPRQPFTATPYAMRSSNSGSADGLSVACVLCVTDAQISAIDGSKVTGTVANAANAATANTANNVSGIVAIANGGTGSSTKNFVDLTTNQSVGGDKTFTGILTGNGSGLTNVPGTFKWNEVTGLTQQAVSNNGYVTSNASQATVTLPASPNVGDTVRITAGGLGGFKIAQNTGQTVSGFHYGTVGATWVSRETLRSWRAIASSSDGDKLVAVVNGGQIYTSTDAGVTWTPRETNRAWISVSSSSDGMNLIAATFPGFLYTSTDGGVNWTQRESSRSWYRTASSADGQKLAAVDIGSGFIYVSDDAGVNWAQRHIAAQWSGIAMSSDGQRMIAARNDGTPKVYISTDGGVNWASTGVTATIGLEPAVASSSDGTKLFVSGSTGTYTSVNSGSTWVASTFTPGVPTFTWHLASSADGSRVVLAAQSAMYTGVLDTSIGAPAGRYIWTRRLTAIGSTTSITSSSDGLRLAGTADAGTILTSSLLTTTGTSGFVTGDYGASIELQYVGGGRWIPISSLGPIKFF